jgi:hypothetical protein
MVRLTRFVCVIYGQWTVFASRWAGLACRVDGVQPLRQPRQFAVSVHGALLSGTLIMILMLFGFCSGWVTQLRQIFRSLSRGLPFIPENARRIRRVGFTVIFGEVGRAVLVYYCRYYTSLHFTAKGARFIPSTDLSVITILGGFAILVIAEVFREGTRLREEQSLTI